ncbi:GerMN domain-containing protein [Candidatus Uhrbacteria bacterium]|nr:GerMN domain-containing protein [Candidatus Uhrbacteria bacterium]
MKLIYLLIGLLAIVGAGIGGSKFMQNKGSVPETPTPSAVASATPTPTPSTDEPVRVFEPTSGATITSPLLVRGEARGWWFFEASFPVKLIDARGHVVAEAPAQADGEWMTDAFVPFHVELKFDPPAIPGGYLVLEKDNPSGLPENAASVQIPVQFAVTKEKTLKDNPKDYMYVKVFWGNKIKDPNVLDCEKTYPTERRIVKTVGVARAALGELIGGPTEFELKGGYFTSLNPEFSIQKLSIVKGTAYVDFDERFNFQVGGACQIQMIRAQVEDTLKQFSTVKNVVISVNGQTELILEP